MTVYVDDQKNRFGRMVMCHMFASTLGELHEMAYKIGVNRKYFQPSGGDHPHYDICLSKRKLAIELGAFQTTAQAWVLLVRAGYCRGR